MNIHKHYLSLVVLFTLSALTAYAHEQSHTVSNEQISVIFDMNGVLTQTNKGAMMRMVGFKKLAAYFLSCNPLTANPRKSLFTFLQALESPDLHAPQAQDEYGYPIPQIMHSWMNGSKTPHEINALVDAQAAKQGLTPETVFVQTVAHLTFTPETFAQTQEVVPEAAAYVNQLKKDGYKLYILSNFCHASFEVLKKQYPTFFNLFDGVVVSAQAGMLKPDPRIYAHTLETYQINPATACFIDDQRVNINAAADAGITSILCPQKKGYLSSSPDITSVKQAFNRWRQTLHQIS